MTCIALNWVFAAGFEKSVCRGRGNSNPLVKIISRTRISASCEREDLREQQIPPRYTRPTHTIARFDPVQAKSVSVRVCVCVCASVKLFVLAESSQTQIYDIGVCRGCHLVLEKRLILGEEQREGFLTPMRGSYT